MNGKPWTKVQLRELRRLYPHVKTSKLERRLRHCVHSIYRKAAELGIRKTAKYLASKDACRLRRGDNVGAAYRYPKGHVPANKGLRRPGWAPGRMRETQFKKGVPSRNAMKLGTTRLIDGYLYVKVAEVPNVPYTVNWKPVHVLNWERVHGPVPDHHCLLFRDGDRRNIALKNLVLVHRRDLMKRNTFHNYPKPIARAIQLRGVLNRRINKLTKEKSHE